MENDIKIIDIPKPAEPQPEVFYEPVNPLENKNVPAGTGIVETPPSDINSDTKAMGGSNENIVVSVSAEKNTSNDSEPHILPAALVLKLASISNEKPEGISIPKIFSEASSLFQELSSNLSNSQNEEKLPKKLIKLFNKHASLEYCLYVSQKKESGIYLGWIREKTQRSLTSLYTAVVLNKKFNGLEGEKLFGAEVSLGLYTKWESSNCSLCDLYNCFSASQKSAFNEWAFNFLQESKFLDKLAAGDAAEKVIEGSVIPVVAVPSPRSIIPSSITPSETVVMTAFQQEAFMRREARRAQQVEEMKRVVNRRDITAKLQVARTMPPQHAVSVQGGMRVSVGGSRPSIPIPTGNGNVRSLQELSSFKFT